MTDVVIVALISLAGTLGGSFLGVLASNKLTNYRIEQLENKVNQHNNLIERTYQIEKDIVAIKKDIEEGFNEIGDLQQHHKS